MASRKELKEQRRRERLEAERRALAAKRRGRRLRLFGIIAGAVALAAGAAAFAALGGLDDDPEDVFAAKPEGLQERVDAARLTLAGDHIHPTVRIVANGQPVPIPEDIGVAADGGPHAPIHRHPGDELLHAEGIEEGAFTLGQFMTVWGVPLSPTRLGPYRADGRRKVTVLVKPKGKAQFTESKEITNLQLRDGDEVYVVYGTPEQSPIVL
jgi:hypothetical protein